jgi:hypothetical protein
MPNNTYRLRFMAFIAVFVICASFLSGSATAVDAVQARKDIKALGLEYYSGQEFAKAAGNDDMAAVRDMGLKGKQSQLKLPPPRHQDYRRRGCGNAFHAICPTHVLRD